MKTIDDVLKAYDICINEKSCDDCPYTEHDEEGKWACSLCGDCTRDTVYYLEQYKKTKELLFDVLKRLEKSENLYHDTVTELSKWEDEDWKDRCLPLTWDELKQMVGKPVWIEYNLHLSDKFFHRGIWIIIPRIEFWLNDEVITYNGYFFCKSEMEEYWKAYKKEKSEMGEYWQAYRKGKKE